MLIVNGSTCGLLSEHCCLSTDIRALLRKGKHLGNNCNVFALLATSVCEEIGGGVLDNKAVSKF